MSDKDLLGKADGLMRRATLAPPATGSDTGAVPILTDFVETLPGAPIEKAAPDSAAAPATAEADALSAEVMARVEEKMQAEMQRLRRELAQAVSDAVREALARKT